MFLERKWRKGRSTLCFVPYPLNYISSSVPVSSAAFVPMLGIWFQTRKHTGSDDSNTNFRFALYDMAWYTQSSIYCISEVKSTPRLSTPKFQTLIYAGFVTALTGGSYGCILIVVRSAKEGTHLSVFLDIKWLMPILYNQHLFNLNRRFN